MNSTVGLVNSALVSCTLNPCDVTVHALKKTKNKKQKTQTCLEKHESKHSLRSYVEEVQPKRLTLYIDSMLKDEEK